VAASVGFGLEVGYLGMVQPESKLSRAIKGMIRAGGGYCIKIHGGPTMEAGTPDLLACIRVELPIAIPDGIGLNAEDRIFGLFVGIETKTPENHRADKDGSEIQKLRAAQIRHAGGVVIIPAKSVQQVSDALDALGWVRGPQYAIPARLRAPEAP
jgi:hypothetical protein